MIKTLAALHLMIAFIASVAAPSASAATPVASPSATKAKLPALSAIGGEFDFTIPNFRGFQQKQTNWCWAAAAETIYYSLTGARLDQTELARIHTNAKSTVVQNKSCEGKNSKSARCNHAADLPDAFDELGTTMRVVDYADPLSSAATYRVLRASLEKHLPLAISIAWPDQTKHSLVVYGAKFSNAATTSGTASAKIKLRVFDPWDSRFYEMSPDRYSPNYRKSNGRWLGRMAIANYKSAKARAVQSNACPFLLDEDRAKFCR